jgi:methylenetetrahydrofolate dehydrogenase (NAD+)
MALDASGKGVLLKADLVADTFRDEVKAFLARSSTPPTLVGILGTSGGPSKFYSEFTRKQCDDLGVRFVLKTVGSAESAERADGEGVEEAIIEANEDADVHGIMVRPFCVSMDHLRSDLCVARFRDQVYYPIYGGQQVCGGSAHC